MTNKLTAYERLTVYKLIYNAPITFGKGGNGMPSILAYKGEPVKTRQQADIIRELDDTYFDPLVMEFIANATKCAREEAIIKAAKDYVLKENSNGQ